MDLVKLEKSQLKKAAAVAAAAFFNYPMMVHYFPDPEKRKKKLPWYLKNVLKSAMRYGEVFATRDVSGVLFILPPGHTRLTTKEYIRCGFLLTPLVLGSKQYKLSSECEKFVGDTHERLMEGIPHYYLWGLVIDPKEQRKGVGTELMKIITDKADEKDLPVYLETHERNNVTYYERFGFRLMHTDVIPGHGMDIWCLLRDAKGKG